MLFFNRHMATPPSSHSPELAPSLSTLKRTRKAIRLKSLFVRLVEVERPLVYMDPIIGKVDGPHRNKLRTYLGVIARDKVDVTYVN